MKIGILSDTHGSLPRTKAAMTSLISNRVKALIHCGDIGSESVIVELISTFQKSEIPIYAVLGNVDYPDDDFLHFHEPNRFEILGRFGEINLGNKRIAIIHGDNSGDLQKAINSEEYDYVFTGHTHKREDSRHSLTRVINPGAVYRASEPSVAILDLDQDKLEFLDLSPAN